MCSLPGTSVCRNGQTSAILVGNQDAGVFVSLDDGANWRFMRGSDRLADITGAFFDESTEDIFVSSFGRGVFRVDAPPQTSLSIGKPQLLGSPPTVSTTTPLTLTAIGRHPVASINYRIYLAGTTGGLFAPVNASTTTFTLANFADGTYNIDFYGTDVNGNQETVQTAQVVLNGGFASIWTQLHPASSPLARDDAGMAYDPVHNQTVVFGGSNVNGNQMGSTWLWNGTNWTQASPSTSPPARYGILNAMTWDPVLQKVVLFGGRTSDGTYQNDTWAWDGTTWSQISSSTKPPGREHHSVDFDTNLNALLLFGGSAGGTYYNDTWKLTSTGWSKLSPATSPSARNLTAMVYDSQAGETVLFGGFISSTNAQTNQTWAFRNGTWTQLSPSTLPPARSKHVMTYDSATSRVVLFGGWDNVTSQPLGDLWTFDGSNWKQQTSSPMPSARYEPSLAYGQGNAIVLFGGATSTTSKLNDTWTLAP